MKITKKMRKKINGMNAATARDYYNGYVKPSYDLLLGMQSGGTTYVNPKNFNL
tara:strand:- start:49 stop:207 length:159 start_codon:yes stop_codon:yes gene_type:complete